VRAVAKWESVAISGECTLCEIEGCLRSEDSAVSGTWPVIALNGMGDIAMGKALAVGQSGGGGGEGEGERV
jgi:hypothetical protein